MPDNKNGRKGSGDSAPEEAKKPTIGFVVCCITGLLSAVFMAAAVTDGNGFLEMKDEQKVIGEEGLYEMKKLPFIGFPYGIGVYKDSFTDSWGEGKRFNDLVAKGIRSGHSSHFTQLYECSDHQTRGWMIVSSSILALISNVAYVVVSVVAMSKGGGQLYGRICLGFLSATTAFLLIALGAAGSFYNDSFTCKQFPLTQGNGSSYSLAMKDLFQLGYAMPFMIMAIIFSIINILIIILSGAINDPKADEDTEPMTQEMN